MFHTQSLWTTAEGTLDRLADSHPLVTSVLIFACIPVGMVLTVALSTTVLALPLGCLLGWL